MLGHCVTLNTAAVPALLLGVDVGGGWSGAADDLAHMLAAVRELLAALTLLFPTAECAVVGYNGQQT